MTAGTSTGRLSFDDAHGAKDADVGDRGELTGWRKTFNKSLTRRLLMRVALSWESRRFRAGARDCASERVRHEGGAVHHRAGGG